MTSPKSRLTVRDNPAQSRFEIDLEGGEPAIAEYRIDSDTIVFTHTVVPPEHEGQGVGSALVHAALDAARKRGLKVDPACAFFAAYMKRHEDVQDLLTAESLGKLGVD